MTDDDTRDLLAAYALDAVDSDERALVEELIATDASARAEVARYEDAIAALAADDVAVEPPAGAWAGIQARIAASRVDTSGSAARADTSGPVALRSLPSRRAGPDDRPTDGDGDGEQPGSALPDDAAPSAPTFSPPRRRDRPASRPDTSVGGRRSWRIALGAAAVAALLVAVLGVVRLAQSSDSDSRSQQLVEALAAPGTRTGTLNGDVGSATVVLTADGKGFVVTGGLQSPGDGKVYQLWALDSGTPVSMGVVSGAIAPVDGPSGSKKLALSLENTPSASQPTLPPVAGGEMA